jgi:hypothetical protein
MNMHPRNIWFRRPEAVAGVSYGFMTPKGARSETDLLHQLQETYCHYEDLNRGIRLAAQRRRYSPDRRDVQRAARQEVEGLARLTRLMDRMRALEGQLLQVREVGRQS